MASEVLDPRLRGGTGIWIERPLAPRRILRDSVFMAWIILIIAGLFEIVWSVAMKQSAGFSRLGPSLLTAAAMLVSFGLLSLAMRSLPLGTAYTVWTGIGAVGAFVVGVAVFGEGLTPLRVAAALLIVAGLVLMKLAG